MENIEKGQCSYKKYAGSKRRSTKIKTEDYMILDAKNLKIKVVASKKIFPSYMGPCWVPTEMGLHAFQLATPTWLHIHNVFHASLLKEYLGTDRSGDSVKIKDQEDKEL